MDPYKVLNVNSDANIDQIKKNYRKLAIALHPDKAPGKEAEFTRVQVNIVIINIVIHFIRGALHEL